MWKNWVEWWVILLFYVIRIVGRNEVDVLEVGVFKLVVKKVFNCFWMLWILSFIFDLWMIMKVLIRNWFFVIYFWGLEDFEDCYIFDEKFVKVVRIVYL